MSNNSKEILYALECGHAAPGADTLVSGVLKCAWHGEAFKIVGVVEYEWRAHCFNCTYVRWAGLSKQNATIFAAGHSRKYQSPPHSVVVEYIKNPNATRTAQKMRDWKTRESA